MKTFRIFTKEYNIKDVKICLISIRKIRVYSLYYIVIKYKDIEYENIYRYDVN